MDRVSKETRSGIMSRIRNESRIEKLPHSLKGLYLRRHPKGIFGKPDFANKTRRVAVFVDGCFWHGCPVHYRPPESNVDFWRSKVERNMARDRLVVDTLTRQGWRVARVWECQLNMVGLMTYLNTKGLSTPGKRIGSGGWI